MVEPPFSLSARDLRASRGGRDIFEGVSFVLAPGEAILLRGANGAGKTTLLRAVAGLLRPAGGAVEFCRDTEEPAENAAIYCGVQNGLKAALSVRENLDFWVSLYGAEKKAANDAINRFELRGFIDRRAGALSTGQARRAGLARLVIAQCPVWLVDEPVAAMDRDGVARFIQLVVDHLGCGGSAIIASHDALDIPGARTMTMSAKAAAP
ncbi:MAG: heme ABC exporter ATP-binding protein CcmA [Marinicaulis sp.]|nr:heme ABC exporter ATP-binding protein CcmA [Marinicaulis sp.]